MIFHKNVANVEEKIELLNKLRKEYNNDLGIKFFYVNEE